MTQQPAVSKTGTVEPEDLATAPPVDDRPSRSFGWAAAGRRVLSVVGMVAVWQIISMIVTERYVPGPLPTFRSLAELATAGELMTHFGATMGRVMSSFVLAMVAGVLVGTVMGLSRKTEQFFDLPVMVALTIPSLCYIIVAFMWFGINERSTVLAITLTTMPAVAINMWSGVKAIDNRLVDMARAFRTSRYRRAAVVVFPQVLPYAVAAMRYSLGLVWKVTVLVELLGRPNGVGYQLNYSFQIFDMPGVFAWTLFFVLIMLSVELFLLKPLEQRLFRWRPTAAA